MLFTGRQDSVGATPPQRQGHSKRSLSFAPLTCSLDQSSHRCHGPDALDMRHSSHPITYHIIRVMVVISDNPYHFSPFSTSILTI